MSVPSYSDESSVDTSSSGPGVATSKNTAALGAASSIFKCGKNPDLSPIFSWVHTLRTWRVTCCMQKGLSYFTPPL